MAERNFDHLQILGREKKVLAGKFFPNGSSAVNNALNIGQGFTVTRTGVGTFTITLTDKYFNLDSAQFNVQLATAAATLVMTGPDDVVSAKTVQITVMQEASGAFAAADIAANAKNAIHFLFILSNSSVIG